MTIDKIDLLKSCFNTDIYSFPKRNIYLFLIRKLYCFRMVKKIEEYNLDLITHCYNSERLIISHMYITQCGYVKL